MLADLWHFLFLFLEYSTTNKLFLVDFQWLKFVFLNNIFLLLTSLISFGIQIN